MKGITKKEHHRYISMQELNVSFFNSSVTLTSWMSVFGAQLFNGVADQVKNKKYNAVGIVPNSNKKIIETEAKSITLTYKYMTSHLPNLV